MPRSLSRSPWAISLLLVSFLTKARAAEPTAPIAEMDLAEAVARFHKDAPSLAQIDGRLQEARANVRLASAPLQPILAAQGGYTRNDAEVSLSIAEVFETILGSLPEGVSAGIDTSALPADLTIQPLEQLSAGASLSVPLVAPSAWADLSTARAVARVAEASADAARQQAEAALIKASWLGQAAEAMWTASQNASAAAAAHLESAQKRQDAGLGTALDVLVAKTELSRRQSEQAQAVADLDRARRALGALLGESGPVRVRVPPPETSAADATEAAQTALAERPDLRAANGMVNAADRAAAAAWWRHAPTLTGTGAAFASDVPYPTGNKTGWKLGLQLTWVLWDGGARYGLLDRARAQGRSAEGAARQAELDVSRQAQDAAEAVEVALARLKLAEDGLRTATAADELANRLYAAGLAGSLDVIDAAQRHLSAEVAQAAAVAQVGVARADLALATGTCWTQP